MQFHILIALNKSPAKSLFEVARSFMHTVLEGLCIYAAQCCIKIGKMLTPARKILFPSKPLFLSILSSDMTQKAFPMR